ncbi:TetR/AcrR family transcriptional regulator [Thermodesulfobacteriota bacterium]
MKKPLIVTRKNHKEKKRKQITRAAAEVFAEKGYAGTVMAEIAVRAGIGKGTIYEYFKSKEDLFFAVFEWYMELSGAAATVGISSLGGPASTRLVALSDALMHTWSEMMDVYSLVMEFWAASASSQMRQRFKASFKKAYEDFRHIVSALIREGIERREFRSDVDPESVAAALVGTWDALFLQAWFDEEFDLFTSAKNFMTVVINGMKRIPDINNGM